MLSGRLMLVVSLLAGCDTSQAPVSPPAVDEAAFDAARAKAVHLQESGADPDEVLAALLAAHALDPTHAGINRRLGQVYLDQDQQGAALEAFRAVVAAAPEDRDAQLTVATL